MKVIFVVFALFLLDPAFAEVALSDFFPYGPTAGDTTLVRNDDAFSAPVPTPPFKFFNKTLDKLWVNTNGAISFNQGISTYTPDCQPVAESYMMVMPYWADVDTRFYTPGEIYYRATTNASLLAKASSEINHAYPEMGTVSVTWAYVSTWYRSTFFGADTNQTTVPENTFQCILATDGTHSFAIFYFNKVTWTTGTASGGDAIHGLGGHPARAGFDAGDTEHFFIIDGSCTANIVNIASQSNIDYRGKFIFRIDDDQIVVPTSFTLPPTVAGTTTGATQAPPLTTAPPTEPPTEAPTTTDPFANVCSGHGSCTCDYGYSGINCETPIDFCSLQVNKNGGNFSEACEPHGHCINDVGIGAHCVCDHGWYGTFCEDHDSSQLVTERCLYRTPTAFPTPTPATPVPVGCPSHANATHPWACVPDNFNCMVDYPKHPCEYPIGWCLPRTEGLDIFLNTLEELKKRENA